MKILSLFIILGLFSACQKPIDDKVITDPAVSKGSQLVSEGNCSYCHTPAKDIGGDVVADMSRYLSGHPEGKPIPEVPDADPDSELWLEFLQKLDSTVWAGTWGVSFSANITPDKVTGIGNWTEDMFVKTMRQGQHMGYGRELKPPMPWQDYGKLTDDDLKAIFAYLQTINPIRNEVPNPLRMR